MKIVSYPENDSIYYTLSGSYLSYFRIPKIITESCVLISS